MRHSTVIFTGSRDWINPTPVYIVTLGLQRRFPKLIIVHGAARGLDTVAEEVCQSIGVKTRPFPAHWSLHGKAAGPIRNREMLKKCAPTLEMVIGFHEDINNSRGTKDMLDLARQSGVPSYLIEEWNHNGSL